MIYIYNYLTLIVLISISFAYLQSEDILSDNMKETIWFETIPPSHIDISLPIPTPIPSLYIPIHIFNLPTKWKPVKTESISNGDAIIVKKKGALRSIIGVFEYYDTNSKRLLINCDNKPNTILLDDIVMIRLKLPGKKRATLTGATLGLLLGMLIGGVENNGTWNPEKALRIVGSYTLSGALMGTLFTSPKSRRLIKFDHNTYEYKVVYNE